MKEKIKANYIYILEFLFFLYIYLNIPEISDRWIGAMGYESFGDIWKYIFTQYGWLTQANARIVSQFVSGILEQNIVLLSFFNALLTTSISILICKTTNKDTFITKFMSAAIMLCVSLGIQAEVYFYATTLYLGAVFFVVAVIYILSRHNSENKNIYNKYLYLIVAMGAFWLESSAISLFAMFLFLCIYYLIVDKKVYKAYIICFSISTIGMGIMFVSSIFASQGRLSSGYKRGIEEIAHNILGVSNEVFYENIGVILLLLLMLFAVYKKIDFIKNSHIKKVIVNTILLGAIFNCILLIARQIFMSIIQNPKEMLNVAEAIGWKALRAPKMYDVFYFIMRIEEFLLPLIGVAIAILIVILIVKLNEFKMIGLILCPVFVGLLFYISGMEKGDRVLSISIFMIGALAVYISSLSSVENMVISKKRIIVLLCTLIFLGVDPMMRTVKSAGKIENERVEIAKQVVTLQQMGEWDYDEIVTMPRYTDDINLIYTEKNPKMEHGYYPFLLMHYGLNENTMIAFSDTKDKLIINQNEKTKNIEWELVPEKGIEYEKFQFQIISIISAIRDDEYIEKDKVLFDSGVTASNKISTDINISDGLYCYYVCTVTTEDGKEFKIFAPQSYYESENIKSKE